MSDVLRIGDPREIVDLTAKAAASGYGHIVPLLNAVQAGHISLVALRRDGQFPRRLLRRATIPTVVLIGDDDFSPSGPSGWTCAEAARGWAKQVLVHGAKGEPSHYRAVVQAALNWKKMLLIECSSATQAAWLDFCAASPKPLAIRAVVAVDGAHPVMPKRRHMQ